MIQHEQVKVSLFPYSFYFGNKMEAFFKEVGRFVVLSSQSKEELASVLSSQVLAKGVTVLRPNTVCNHVHFVEKGLLRTYYQMDGRDITDWLSPENSFSCSILSFINRQPDRRGIEALENSSIWSLGYADLSALYDRYHDIERLGRMLYGSGIMQMQQRFDDLHFHTAQERYQNLMNTNPSLIQRTPLNMLASYLGMTKETLSRIRSQYAP